MIWFTADLHLGHEAIIRMQERNIMKKTGMQESEDTMSVWMRTTTIR